MSYCRWSSGSVYMYKDVEGGITCCGCNMAPEDLPFPNFATEQEALNHLYEHRNKGDKVPEFAIERLKSEIESGKNEDDF